ncbi:hypothetical protein Tco_1284390 [Tanacetum coccineum]
MLPLNAILAEDFYQGKKMVKKLILGYVKIHACPNDCMLYWDDNADERKCHVWSSSFLTRKKRQRIINLASSLDHLRNTSPSCNLVSLDQHAHTLCYLESCLTISLDKLFLDHFTTLRKMLNIRVAWNEVAPPLSNPALIRVDSKNLLDRISSYPSLFSLPKRLKADNTIRVNQLVTI